MMNRARDAEAALLAVIGIDLPHPADPAVFHDASQELLAIYATEDRVDDAHFILWKVYDRATPAYRPTVLAMQIQSELERSAPTESVRLLNRYVTADLVDWEARRALANAELALGQRSEALREMRERVDARPEDPRVWLDNLTMLQSLGEVDAFNFPQTTGLDLPDPRLVPCRGRLEQARRPLGTPGQRCQGMSET